MPFAMMNERTVATLPVVLVVDDDSHTREMIVRQLRGLAIVVEAHDATEALGIARHFYFDCVISDLEMPCMSGAALLRSLHAVDPKGHRLLVTGACSGEIDDLVKDGIVDGFVAKPFTARRLREALIRACYGSSEPPPSRSP
jgi:CheY-like chemotaxis protein